MEERKARDEQVKITIEYENPIELEDVFYFLQLNLPRLPDGLPDSAKMPAFTMPGISLCSKCKKNPVLDGFGEMSKK